MDISGKTKICAIVGNPVQHTLSPAMHNAAFKKLGLDYLYLPFRVFPDELGKAVDGLKALGVVGFNVTIPHKVNIMPLLTRLDPLAEKIGAVNTVVLNQNPQTSVVEMTGYNTDAPGFIRALTEQGFKPEGKKIVILGAGGAARAVAYSLVGLRADLVILNRKGAADWTAGLGPGVRVMALGCLRETLVGAALLVNTTSVGMVPQDKESLVPAEMLAGVPLVFDIVYHPAETRLLKEARTAGARTISGVEMLVWQGALAFELWTRHNPPVDLMRQVVLEKLERYEN